MEVPGQSAEGITLSGRAAYVYTLAAKSNKKTQKKSNQDIFQNRTPIVSYWNQYKGRMGESQANKLEAFPEIQLSFSAKNAIIKYNDA